MTQFDVVSETPRKAGFRMIPEWEKQEGVYLSWPHNPETWPGCMERVQKTYADFATEITRFENLHVILGNKTKVEVLERLENAGADLNRVICLNIQTNDAWCRDHGPIFVKNEKTSEIAVVKFRYNSWGGKFPPWNLDDAVPLRIAEKEGLKLFQSAMTCEGGALEVNACGDLVTTESVLLNGNRNPGLSKSEAERILGEYLGINRTIWLESGMVGDDTDGHVDTLARFVRNNVMVTAACKSGRNCEILERNREILAKARNSNGEKIETIPLPCPEEIHPENWREELLPATYTNYLLVNGGVLLPTYRDEKSDKKAIKIIGECFPDREIVPIDCFDILLEGGALHCLSQQRPF